jgi:hypothetical protein
LSIIDYRLNNSQATAAGAETRRAPVNRIAVAVQLIIDN